MRHSSRVTLIPGQLVLDLFPDDGEDGFPSDRCVGWLVGTYGCEEARVRPLVDDLFSLFGVSEGFERAKVLGYFYGDDAHSVPRLRACPPSAIGVFDRGLDYHAVWDRCWAARWVPLREAFEVREWTGAPVWVWYIDMEGREIKRPFEGD